MNNNNNTKKNNDCIFLLPHLQNKNHCNLAGVGNLVLVSENLNNNNTVVVSVYCDADPKQLRSCLIIYTHFSFYFQSFIYIYTVYG